jgi:formylmethanofuran dehydrogenase subunit E
VFEKDDVIYIFNAYHKDNLILYNMATLLATYLGVTYKKVSINAPNAYINGDGGFAIAPPDKIEAIAGGRYDSITLDFANSPEGCWECENCNSHFGDTDDMYDTANGSTICWRCYEDHYFRCEDCDEIYHTSVMHNVEGNCYCGDCYNSNFTECEKCGNAVSNDNTLEENGEYYCPDCYAVWFTSCEKCGDTIDKKGATSYNGDCYCDVCYEDIIKEDEE